MRDNKWYSGLAFGLVVGLAISALLFAWLSGGLPGWWKHDGALVTSKDTLANWLVAIFSIIAALFLWLTLRATQEMARDTRRIGEAQVRAYLTFSGSEVAYGSEDGPATYFLVRPKFKNTGQSPGIIVYAFCSAMLVDELASPIDCRVGRANQYRTKLKLGSGEERWTGGLSISVEDAARAFAEHKIMLFFGCIEFTDTFGDDRRSEDFCFTIAFNGDPATRCGHSWTTHQDYKVQLL